MIVKLNPVLIAGFDILFLGKNGFSTLARAEQILVRTKTNKKKKYPWVKIDVRRFKSKAEKEKALYGILQKESFGRDISKNKKKKKKLPKYKKEKKTDEIKFHLTSQIDKVIKTPADRMLLIRKATYEMNKAIVFVKGKNYELESSQAFINAVKNEFKKIQKKYGKKDYFIRLHHQYKGLPSNVKIDPEGKGFGGYAIRRQAFHSVSRIDGQFDNVLSKDYPDSFSRYLKFATSSTSFDFIGFMVEITMEDVTDKFPKKEPVAIRRAKMRATYAAEQEAKEKQKLVGSIIKIDPKNISKKKPIIEIEFKKKIKKSVKKKKPKKKK